MTKTSQQHWTNINFLLNVHSSQRMSLDAGKHWFATTHSELAEMGLWGSQ